MGGGWDGHLTGTFGIAGCFNTQTFKHVNSGEGGLLVTDDEDFAARAILLSGSYMLYTQRRRRVFRACYALAVNPREGNVSCPASSSGAAGVKASSIVWVLLSLAPSMYTLV